MKSLCIAAVLGALCSSRVGASPNESGIVAPPSPLEYVESFRTCHKSSHSMAEDIGVPYAVADPPEKPFPSAELQFALIVQRHGTRRSHFSASQTEHYKDMGAGQLLVQGAYELRVSGAEVRKYLQTFTRRTVGASTAKQLREVILNETCGFDIREDCASYGLEGNDCTPSALVNAIASEFPAETVYVRASEYRRTQWSAIFFLEGFYGLPWGCAGTTEELSRSPPQLLNGRRCLLREVCDGNPSEVLYLRGKHQETCSALALPCMHAPPTANDALTAAAIHNRVSFAQAQAHYLEREGPRIYVPTGSIKDAIEVAEQVYDMAEFEHYGGSWNVGEMWLSEVFAGEKTPMKELKKFVDTRKAYCAESGECDPDSVPSYEGLVENLKEGFRVGYESLYGIGGFAKFTASPYIMMFNALSRAIAFGRPEDLRDLRLLMKVLSDFDDLGVDDEELLKESTKRIKLYLLSLHDFVLVGVLGALGVSSNELTPFASRFSLELVKAPRGEAKEFKSASEPFDVEKALNPGGHVEYPENGYFVRLLLGQPGKTMAPLSLPFCGHKLVCPLNVFLNATYGLLESYGFLDVTQVFRNRLREFAEKV